MKSSFYKGGEKHVCAFCGSVIHPEVNRLYVSAVFEGELCSIAVCSCCLRRLSGMSQSNKMLVSMIVQYNPDPEELEKFKALEENENQDAP